MVRLQGTKDDPVSEEEPGRIHHEYRHLYVGGKKVGKRQQELLAEISSIWGGSEREVIYYGAVDATPQLVRLVASHCHVYGPAILDAEFIHRSGASRTIRDSVLSCLAWLERRIAASGIGLLEFKRANPHGIIWQAMRDGRLSYLHEDGSLANAESPVASLEVQGLAYDALLYGAELFVEELPEEAARWSKLAAKLQKETLSRFWMPKEDYFGMAIDRDPEGNPRLLTARTSVPAELLETRIFDSLAEKERAKYIGAIVRVMYSDDFLTDVGVRSRALRHQHLLPLWDYQGSNVSWMVTTNVFSLGLRRQGFIELAEDMDNRMLNAANIAKQYVEYFFVDNNGHVHYHNLDEPDDHAYHTVVIGTNRPENTQAWTVSALLGALLRRVQPKTGFPPNSPSLWQRQIEVEILERIQKAPLFTTEEEVATTNPEPHRYYVDRAAGQNLEADLLKRHGLL